MRDVLLLVEVARDEALHVGGNGDRLGPLKIWRFTAAKW